MVDEASELFAQHDDGSIGDVDLLGTESSDSPFTHDEHLDTNLEGIFDDEEEAHPDLPSLDSPLTSPPRSADSSVGSGEAALLPKTNSNASLGLPGNELVEEDWRNDAHDLRARKDILLQIVKILHARKENPTKKWLGDLPYKARKLEEQLYQGASSLEDYSDKRTLKHRLKRVARAIKSKYRSSLKSRSSPTKSSAAIRASQSSSKNSSNMSSNDMEPLQATPVTEQQEQQQQKKPSPSPPPQKPKEPASHRSSMVASELATLQALVNERQQQKETPPRRSSLSNLSPSDLAYLQHSFGTPTQQLMQRRDSANIVTPRTTPPSIASELASLRAVSNNSIQRQRQTQQRSSMNVRSSSSNNNADLSALLSGEGHIHPPRIHGNRRTSLPPTSNAIDRYVQSQQPHPSSGAMRPEASIEERQAANQKLQEQILENIRQQQVLMRELMVGKNQSSQQQQQQRHNVSSRINMGNSSKSSNMSQSMSSLLNSSKADQLLNNHRQLPMNLLQQSLARGSANESARGSSNESDLLLQHQRQQQQQQQQRRNSNYPSNIAFTNSLQDEMSPDSTFNW